MQNEIWLLIPGTTYFEISNLGRVRNTKTGKILKHKKVMDRYIVRVYVVDSNGNEKVKHISVPNLVFELFKGGKTSSSYKICYRDGNIENCAADNLYELPRNGVTKKKKDSSEKKRGRGRPRKDGYITEEGGIQQVEKQWKFYTSDGKGVTLWLFGNVLTVKVRMRIKGFCYLSEYDDLLRTFQRRHRFILRHSPLKEAIKGDSIEDCDVASTVTQRGKKGAKLVQVSTTFRSPDTNYRDWATLYIESVVDPLMEWLEEEWQLSFEPVKHCKISALDF